MPIRRQFPLVPVVVLLVASAACGGGGDGPVAPKPVPPSVRVVAGDRVTDTVMTAPVQALVVEVRDSLGRPMPGALVRFTALPSDPTRMYQVTMYVCPLTQPVCGTDAPFGYGTFSSFAVDSSNASGRASALVRLGTIAGLAKVLVTVPELGVQDTARFTVMPGAPARVVATVRDTAILVDRTYSVQAAVTDRYGNPRGETVSYSSDPLVSVSSTGTVRGLSVGRGRVIARAGTGGDTVMVSVVPTGHIAAYRTYGPNISAIVEFDADGSNYKVRSPVSGSSTALTSWLSNGDVLYHDAQPGTSGVRIYRATPSGVATKLLGEGAMASQYSAQPSRTGGYVFFFGSDVSGQGVFRVREDGTQLEALAGAAGGAQPAPSPDGSRVAFVRSGQLFVLDVASGAVTNLQRSGAFPRWSPAGDRIAYLGAEYGGAINLVNADGTAARTVSSSSFSIWMDWSPDGEWIVAGRDGRIVLVRVSSGEELPIRLPVPDSHFQPSWRY